MGNNIQLLTCFLMSIQNQMALNPKSCDSKFYRLSTAELSTITCLCRFQKNLLHCLGSWSKLDCFFYRICKGDPNALRKDDSNYEIIYDSHEGK